MSVAASDVELQRYLESEAALLEDLQATRLAQLRATRRRLDEMARAEARVRTKVRALDVLDAAAERDATAQALVRPLFHTGTALRDMEFHVAELRRRLAAARVAEDGGGRHEQLYAHDNAIRTADHLINGYLDASLFVAAGAMSVLEIAAHALAMFSGKPECRNLLFANGCVETAARLLKRTFSAAVVAHACAVVGNMASHDEARGRLRIMGAVGALVRLLRADCPAQVQVAAAGALALLASRDDVICDTVRVLGGLELLVAMLAHPTDVGRAEVARVTLHTLRKGNEANARSIAQTIKLDPNLVGVAHKHPYLEDFMDLSAYFSYSPSHGRLAPPAVRRPGESLRLSYPSGTWAGSSPLKAALQNVRENLEGIRYGDSPLLTTAQRRPRSAAASPACVSSPGRYLAGTNTSTLRAARASSPGGVAGRLPLSGTATPLRCAAAAAFSPSRSLRTSFAGTAMRPPSPPPAAAVRRIDEAWAGSLLLPLLPHHVKHVCHFSNEEVLLLLETVGLDSPSALDRVRLAGTTGRQLLSLSPQDLELSLGLTKLQARKVGQLQQAVALYDKIALQPGQGTLSEVELRMFLAGRGASSGQTSAMLKLMRTLVSGRSGAPEEGDTDLLGCFDFVAGFDWIAQLLKLHRIPVD